MINVIAPINQLGYGIASLNIVKALSKIEDVALWPISQPQVTNEQDANVIRKCIDNSKYPDFNAPCIRIWHQHDMAQFVGRGERIGFPIFELDKFSDLEKHHLANLNKIFVCSQWAKGVISKELNTENVNVIPLGVDTSVFKPSSINNNEETVFLNCGKWEVRKGHDILVDIFNATFDISEKVQLWLLPTNPFLSEEEKNSWHNKYYKSKLGSKIRILPRLNTQEEVYNIMQKTSCGIFPSRAEGWNLELLELMACGKPVITTNYSAHTEFCNEHNSLLVNITETEVAHDNKWFYGQGNWAKISNKEIAQFSEYMRQIHLDNISGNLAVNTAGIETANKFNWNNTAEIIKNNV
jgi:glycosyltransferase involved in cell wall biosynthesis